MSQRETKNHWLSIRQRTASAVESSGACGLALPALLALLLASTGAVAQIKSSAVEQIRAIVADKALRTPAQHKIDSRLLETERQRAGRASPNGAPTLRTGISTDNQGRVLVDISGTVTAELEKAIKVLNGDILFSSARFSEIRAAMPLGALERLAARQDVRFVHAARKAGVNMINVSEGDVAHGADAARATFGVDGSGITIGVLSDGVDELVGLQGSGDLPPVVTVLPGQAGGGSEGTAMLEIVHDLAPGSDLVFATAFGGPAAFAQNILDLQAAGATVIVDDIFYFNESPFQDDIISQAVNTVTAAGVAYFSSAGNAGNFNDGTSGTWEGDFVDGGALPSPIGGAGAPHNWGGSVTNQVTVDSPFAFTLQWADPLAASTNDYDLFLLSAAGTTVVANSTNTQNGTQDPFELIDSDGFNDTNTLLVVVANSGAAGRFLHLSSLRGQTAFNTPGETKGHSTADDAFGVAAVDVATASGGLFTGGGANPVETFSSDGPRQIFFEPDGTPITPGNFSSTGGRVRAKPDLSAADGVATATSGFNPFFGTSAAAPHAAAIAALVLEKQGGANLRQIFSQTALDIEAPGPDRDSGVGIIRADLAVDATLLPQPCCNTGGPGCVDAAIEAAVCAADSFCCDTAWDDLCVEQVTSVAGDNCDCCTASDEAEGCFDNRPLAGGGPSAWNQRHSLERMLYAADPQAFEPRERESVLIESAGNLRQPTRVRVDQNPTRPVSVHARASVAESFPSEDSSQVSDGFAPPGQLGFFWSVSRGDRVSESFGPDLAVGAGQVNRAVFDFSVPINSLTSVGLDWDVFVNGADVGAFTVAVGQTGPVHLDFSFPPVASASGIYVIDFVVTNEIPAGGGSITLGTDGTVQLIGEFTDDISDCVCASDSYCCEEVWDSICVDEVQALGCGLCETCAAPPPVFGPNPADGQTNVLPDQDLAWNTSGGCSVANGDFESGSFAGWTPVTGPGAELTPWNVSTAATSPGFFANALPFDGLHFAQNGFDGEAGLFYELHQDIMIPAFATSAIVAWSERIQWDMFNFGGSTLPREYEVTVQPAGGGTPYGVLYSTMLDPGTLGDTGYVPHAFDIAGIIPPSGTDRTVRLSFRQFIPEFATGPAQFDIDGIGVQCASGPGRLPKLDAIAGSRSTPEREAHWRARFAEKVALYDALQAGKLDVSALHGAAATRDAAPGVPAGYTMHLGGRVPISAAPAKPFDHAQTQQVASEASRMLTGTLINFDDSEAPCALDETTRLTDEYAPLGVTFLGPGGQDGGAILDECGGFDVTGQSSTNFLAFVQGGILADGGEAVTPETLLFDPPVRQVQAKVGVGFGITGSVTMDAYDALGTLVDSDTVSVQSLLQPIRVEGESIVRVVLTNTPDVAGFVLDDLRFEACPITYDVLFGTDPGALSPVPQCTGIGEAACDLDPLQTDTPYFWQVIASSLGGSTPGPVWSFTTSGDEDGDGVVDAFDNCITFANPGQEDSNGDGFGNACDADITQSCNVSFGDLSAFKAAFPPNPPSPDADFNGNGLVDFGDLARLKETFFNGLKPGPGPSANGANCVGGVAVP